MANDKQLSMCHELKPRLSFSIKVYHALQAMQYTGVDMLVDVHADEELPHTFVACNEGIPG
eukprot:gene17877-24268_t